MEDNIRFKSPKYPLICVSLSVSSSPRKYAFSVLLFGSPPCLCIHQLGSKATLTFMHSNNRSAVALACLITSYRYNNHLISIIPSPPVVYQLVLLTCDILVLRNVLQRDNLHKATLYSSLHVCHHLHNV